MEFLQSLSVENILFYALLAHGVAVVITNATPTPRDDKWAGKFYKVIEIAAGLFGKTVKELPGERDDLIAEAEKEAKG